MASKVDMSLDELVEEKSWKRPPQFTRKNKPYPFTQRPSVKERLGQPHDSAKPTTSAGQAISDLRDVLAQKQKSTITDLRVKITPKETQSQPPVQGKTAQTRIKPAPAAIRSTKAKAIQAKGGHFKSSVVKGSGQGKGGPFKAGPNKPIMSSTPSVGRNRTRGSVPSSPEDDSYIHNGGQLDSKSARNTAASHHPPSYEDTKKITVTISGLNKPLSEVRIGLSTPWVLSSHPSLFTECLHCCKPEVLAKGGFNARSSNDGTCCMWSILVPRYFRMGVNAIKVQMFARVCMLILYVCVSCVY